VEKRYAGVVDGGIRLVWYPKEKRLKKTELEQWAEPTQNCVRRSWCRPPNFDFNSYSGIKLISLLVGARSRKESKSCAYLDAFPALSRLLTSLDDL
jgi:hypothetical protein